MNMDKVETLKMLYSGNPTIPEVAARIGKANATVHKILQELVVAGMVTPPRLPRAARDYHITDKGAQYLLVNGYVKEELSG